MAYSLIPRYGKERNLFMVNKKESIHYRYQVLGYRYKSLIFLILSPKPPRLRVGIRRTLEGETV